MQTSNSLHTIPARWVRRTANRWQTCTTWTLPAFATPILAAVVLFCAGGSVAQADECQALFPEQSLRSTFSAGLPDCRGYEQVTPAFKGGGSITPVAVSADGNAVDYGAFSAFTGSSGGAREVFYQARRTAAGWRSASFFPSSTQIYSGLDAGYPAIPYDVSLDLHRLLTVAWDNPNHDVTTSGTVAFYLFTPDGVDGCSTPDGSGCAVSTTPPGGLSAASGHNITAYLGGSADLSHLFFDATALVPGDPTTGPFPPTALGHDLTEDYNVGTATAPVYRYRLVGLDNSGNPLSLISDGATVLGSGSVNSNIIDPGVSYESEFHAVSNDGSRVFFTAKKNRRLNFATFTVSDHPSLDELFARVDGNTTIPISVPEVNACQTENEAEKPLPESCSPVLHPEGAVFEGASADSSKVYFTTTQPEVPGVTDTTTNLYLARLDSSSVTAKVRVSAGDPGDEARVQGVVRISQDGTHVYFVAQGALTSIPGPEGQTAQPGADNLYSFDADSGQTRLVALLCSAQGLSGTVVDTRCVSHASDAALWGTDDHREAQSTPDGHELVFDSNGALTADDTDTAKDVYLYNSDTGTLQRVSHGRGGYDGDGNDSLLDASIEAPNYADASLGGAEEFTVSTGEAKRAISEDGSRVFFSTSEALQPSDVNSAPDVYEWDNGQVALISDGQNPDTARPAAPGDAGATEFQGASQTGNDAFFATTTVLDPAGGDSAYDFYDARVGGGFAPPTQAAQCTEADCQGPISTPPPVPTPGGSATQAGGGNLPPAAEPKPLAAKPLTAAQLRARKLTAALKTCKRDKSAAKRKSCERTARHRYTPIGHKSTHR